MLYILIIIYIIFSAGNLNDALIIEQYKGTYIYIIFLSYIIILYYLIKNKNFIKIFSKIKIPFLLLLMVPTLSTILSDNILYSSLSLLGLCNTLIIAIFLAQKFSLLQFMRLIVVSGVIVFYISLIFITFIPDSGIHTVIHTGSWRGIYAHKNILGLFSLLYFSSSIYLFFLYKKSLRKVFYLFNTFASFLLIIESNSKTALIFSIISIITILVVKIAEVTKINLIKFIFISILSLFLIGFITNNIYVGNLGSSLDYLSIFGIEIPLTGRLTIWMFSLSKIFTHLYFGYGYNAFWKVSPDSNIAKIGLGDFSIDDAHNGIINALLSFGIVGTLIILLVIIHITFLYYKYYISKKKNFSAFMYFYLNLIFLFSNITESTLYKSTNLYQLIFFYLIFSFYLYIKPTMKRKSKCSI
jgi:O-antigen ligase